MDDFQKFKLDDISLDNSNHTGRILFKPNSSYVVCGHSGSGKTTFIAKLLQNIGEMIQNANGCKVFILYCYSTSQALFRDMTETIDNISFHKGIPNEDLIAELTGEKNRHLIMVVDDLMREALSSQIIFDFFTVKAHHLGTSVIYVSHNLFQQGEFSRSITLNASYFVLFQNPRGADQIQTLSKQMFPGRGNAVVQAYNMANNLRPFSYLVLDMTANIPEALRMRTCIFPDEITRFYTFEKS